MKKQKSLLVRLDPELHYLLKLMAAREKISIRAIVTQLLMDYVGTQEAK